MKMVHLAASGLSLAAVFFIGSGAAHAQSADDVTAVTAANSAFYAAQTALDMPSMEKVWAHEAYIEFAGPRAKEPTVGWAALEPYLVRNFGNMSQFSLKPVDMQVHVYGASAWVFGKEGIGNGSTLKDGTVISSRPTIVTN